jgi:hypothetical protein
MPKKILKCGHCGNKTTFQVKESCEQKEGIEYDTNEIGDLFTRTFSKTIWYLLSCETCSAATVECVIEYCVAHPEEGPNTVECDELDRHIVYPIPRLAPDPIAGMPEDVKKDYEEASAVLAHSPRACAALLRLALQRLCVHLGQPGRVLNDDIRALVQQRGLKPQIQQALDIVRVTGNNAVHPGAMDLDDNQEIALSLFTVINLIVEEMIVIPNQIQESYSALPERDRNNIARRDHPGS